VTGTEPGGATPTAGNLIDRIGVVVPVHNEQDTLPRCLHGLAVATCAAPVPVTTVLILDACTDSSAAVAGSFAMPGLQTISVAARCVGSARAAGMSALLRQLGRSGTWLATTDADSVVPPNWLSAQSCHAKVGARVVAGTISVTDWEGRSSALAERAERDYRANAHRHVHGANLSFAADAYCAAGGFPPVTCDEDVQLVDAFRRNNEAIAWATDMPVVTSARREARAPQGFANYLSSLEQSMQSRHRSLADVEVPRAM
jgi:glycosyltransferase involved in cell wall biosynthesis